MCEFVCVYVSVSVCVYVYVGVSVRGCLSQYVCCAYVRVRLGVWVCKHEWCMDVHRCVAV